MIAEDMIGGEQHPSEATKMLSQCVTGEITEANMIPALLHLHRTDPVSVLAALAREAERVVVTMEQGQGTARVVTLLAECASAIGREDKECAIAKELLDHVLMMTSGVMVVGGPICSSRDKAIMLRMMMGSGGRSPKERVVRAQSCILTTALLVAGPGHTLAENKLREYACDRVPSIREKAVRGLALNAHRSESVQLTLVERSSDLCVAVRAAAVRGLYVSGSSGPALLQRLDDVDPCVRAELFRRLGTQPEAISKFGPVALTRLLSGLGDKSVSVRAAGRHMVEIWSEQLGGLLPLFARCDLVGDEVLSESAVRAVVKQFPREVGMVSRAWLQPRNNDGHGCIGPGDIPAALITRAAVAAMDDSERNDVLDMPLLLERARSALLQAAAALPSIGDSHSNGDFLLRQLLCILAAADICDEGLRREVADFAESVLRKAPLSPGASSVSGSECGRTTIDFGLVLLRQTCGLGPQCRLTPNQRQMLEARCSMRAILLVSDLYSPLNESDSVGAGGLSGVSSRLAELIKEIDARSKKQEDLVERKQQAILSENYVAAQELKDEANRNSSVLESLRVQHQEFNLARDSLCLRILAIISAALRFSNSIIRRDPALFGTLDSVLRPIVQLPSLSAEVEVAALAAIALFSTHDVETAREHWGFFMALLRRLSADSSMTSTMQSLSLKRATVAARMLADCSRLHVGTAGGLDASEVVGAAIALAVVPYRARELVLQPLCGWLLSCGPYFFDAHLREKVPEVQWALGWMLAESFAQRNVDSESNDGTEVPEVPAAQARQLLQFFSLLPRLPYKHGAAMLLLAAESVVESGLWRRAVLLPQSVCGKTVWLRGFSWPRLFAFVHTLLPSQLRWRLWRCSLQLCISHPELAQLAEVPLALAKVAADAPAGAPELLGAAAALAESPAALAQLRGQLPFVAASPEAMGLVPGAEARAAERDRRADLMELGVDIDNWCPGSMEVPTLLPPQHRRFLCGAGSGRGARAKDPSAARKHKNSERSGAILQEAMVASPAPSSIVALVASPAISEAPSCYAPAPEKASSSMPPPAEKRRRVAKPKLPLRETN